MHRQAEWHRRTIKRTVVASGLNGLPSLARTRFRTRMERGDFQFAPGFDQQARQARIRCPHCRWQPRRSDHWACCPAGAPEHFEGGCGTVWHTFDTRGLCPGCGYQWRHTMCLRCGQWALHQAWYEENGQGEAP